MTMTIAQVYGTFSTAFILCFTFFVNFLFSVGVEELMDLFFKSNNVINSTCFNGFLRAQESFYRVLITKSDSSCLTVSNNLM